MGLTDEKKGRYVDGFQPLTTVCKTDPVSLPVTSGVAISRGDCLVLTSGYLALATTLTDVGVDIYIAIGENTAAEASSDGAKSCLCIPIVNTNIRFQVPVTTDAILDAADVGVAYNLDGSEDGISNAGAKTDDTAFMVERIDISAAAVAVEPFGYAIGRFVQYPTS